MERSEQIECVGGDKDNGVDNSDDSADKHLTHLTHFKNNGNIGVRVRHLTHVVKNTPESLR
eukprot:5825984-Ditylum_brightwellii.AAC.1